MSVEFRESPAFESMVAGLLTAPLSTFATAPSLTSVTWIVNTWVRITPPEPRICTRIE